VSVQQVLEAEKKLRLSSVLSLKSDKLGHVAIRELRNALTGDDDANETSSSSIPGDFKQVAAEAIDMNFSCD
jgi:hypothetical protein